MDRSSIWTDDIVLGVLHGSSAGNGTPRSPRCGQKDEAPRPSRADGRSGDPQGPPLPISMASPGIRIRADRMAAEINPSAFGGAVLGVGEIRAAALAAGVVFGLDRRRIEALATLWQRGELPAGWMGIASGQPPRPPRAERLEFEGEDEAGAEETIDHRDQGRYTRVRRGQRIARWIAPRDGAPGKCVEGTEIPCAAAEAARFEAQAGVVLEPLEDNTFAVIAGADGALMVEDGWRLSVLDVLRIEGDVDLETGHIESSGNVVITGSVRASFRVTSDHDIEVQGTVEDAQVVAGGKLTVGGGIIGGDFGFVRAVKSLWVRHAQNARIECDGDVTLGDSDLGSTITAGGALRATEGRGRLSGGTYRAALGVMAQELGSPLGAATALSVGLDPALERELAEAQAQLATLEKAISHVVTGQTSEAASARFDRSSARALREAIRRRIELRRDVERLTARIQALFEHFGRHGPAAVDVKRAVHGGVSVEIGGFRLTLDERGGPRTFALDRTTGAVA